MEVSGNALNPSKSRQMFSSLESMRGVAAIWVVFYHMTWTYPGMSSLLVRNGYLFVDFFFVLSGFVICHAYQDRVQNSRDFKEFVIVRLGRIYPIHFVFLMIFFGLECTKFFSGGNFATKPFEFNSPGAFVSNLFLVHGLNLHPKLTFNTPSWSISVEFWTYIVFALVVLFLRKRLIWVSAVIMLVSGILLGYLKANLDVTYDYSILRCLMGFFLGVLCYHTFLRFHEPMTRGLKSWGNAIELLLVGTLLAFLLVKPALCSLDFWMAPITFAMVLIFAFESGWVSKLLNTRVLLFLGKISFSIYMSHIFVLTIFRSALKYVGKYQLKDDYLATPSLIGILACALSLALVIGISALCYTFIEDTCRKRVKNWVAGARKRKEGAVA